MSIKLRIVRTLLRVYPPAWRGEYGSELSDILLARRLDARAIGDVLWSGLRQRIRSAEPSTLFGCAAMLVILAGVVWNIAAPPPAGHGLPALLQESSKTLPTVIVKPLASGFYVLFLVGCGCWTHLRDRGTLSRSGVAAMRMSFIAGIPVMAVGVLMLAGILGVIVLGPGEMPTTFYEHGFTYTYYNAQHHPLGPLGVLSSPLFKLPESWIWGMVGGQVGRAISRSRRRQPAGS